MIGAGGPKMLRLAALHADIWSWYVKERSDLAEFAPRLAALEAACLEVGRDPATIGRSAGIASSRPRSRAPRPTWVYPCEARPRRSPTRIRAFAVGGFTSVEVMVWPPTMAALDALAPVIELLDAD